MVLSSRHEVSFPNLGLYASHSRTFPATEGSTCDLVSLTLCE